MRNKILDHFLQLSNVSFIFGIVLTVIVFKNISLKDASELGWWQLDWWIKLSPFYIFTIVALVFAGIFAFYRKNYFILIFQHLTPKSIKYYKISVYFLFFNIFVAIVLMFVGVLYLLQYKTSFFLGAYLYIVLGILMALTLADVVIDSISRLKVKLDLSIRRGGADELLEKSLSMENGVNQNESSRKTK